MNDILEYNYFFNDIAMGRDVNVAAFLSKGLDINYQNRALNFKFNKSDAENFFKHCRGVTPLMMAAFFDRYALVDELLQHGAKGDVKTDNTELTAPMIAVQNNALMSLSVMVKHGVDLKVLDKHGETLIDNLIDAQKPVPEVLKYLLDQGVDPNRKNREGNTPFMRLMDVKYISPFSRDFKLWNLLIDYSVDLLIKNNKGETVIDLLNKRDVLHVYPRIQETHEHQLLMKNVSSAERHEAQNLKF